MMSPNEAETYRHVCSYFTDAELGFDRSTLDRMQSILLIFFFASTVVNLDFPEATLPPTLPSLTLVKSLQLGPQFIYTFCLIKPDGIVHFPKILQRINNVRVSHAHWCQDLIFLTQEKFAILALRMVSLSKSAAESLVRSSPADWPGSESDNVAHLLSGPCIALSLRKEDAVRRLLLLAGSSLDTS